MSRRKKYSYVYLPGDYFSGMISWILLYYFRKFIIEDQPLIFSLPLADSKFYLGLFLIPAAWCLLHYLSGTYTDLFRKSRLRDLFHSMGVSVLGSLILFFTLLLDDLVRGYADYYLSLLLLMVSHFVFTYGFRLIWLQRAKRMLASGEAGFNTLLLGTAGDLEACLKTLQNPDLSPGTRLMVKAFWRQGSGEGSCSVGSAAELPNLVNEYGIEEVVLALPSSSHQDLNDIINRLADREVWIKIVPDMYDILSGTARLHHVVGDAFIEIPPRVLKEWQRIVKRWFDVIFSLIALILLLPVFALVALMIWMEGAGPIFYRQERLGQYGKPFRIIKFRSMVVDAEKAGPALSSDHDSRITRTGRWMRKYRLDELPQFINVLKGEMSIVGPRAERRFYADQIMAVAPYYTHLFRVQPGITSLGMVKYGYASDVEEMVRRLRYDILYMENMGFLMDFKILIYTVRTVLMGKGK